MREKGKSLLPKNKLGLIRMRGSPDYGPARVLAHCLLDGRWHSYYAVRKEVVKMFTPEYYSRLAMWRSSHRSYVARRNFWFTKCVWSLHKRGLIERDTDRPLGQDYKMRLTEKGKDWFRQILNKTPIRTLLKGRTRPASPPPSAVIANIERKERVV